jgi:predicted amidohydrolase YtcJ
MGSLLPDMAADFVVLDIDFLNTDLLKIRKTKAISVFIDGKEVK